MTEADWGAVAVTRAPGFADARSVVELGAGDFSRSLALGERYPAKTFLSTDYTFSAKAKENLDAVAAQRNVEVAEVDARSVDLPPDSVDFMFSIALMEHVAEVAECLAAVARALRPGGVYFYIQAPFWTCAQGHHYRHADDRTYDFIPKYSHLTHDRDGLADLLRRGPEPPFDIDACVEAIYHRPDLSRLGPLDTRAIVEAGPLHVESWTESPDRRYDERLARDAFEHLLWPARFDELRVCTADVVLRKLPTGRPTGAIGNLARRAVRRVRRR